MWLEQALHGNLCDRGRARSPPAAFTRGTHCSCNGSPRRENESVQEVPAFTSAVEVIADVDRSLVT